MSNLIIFSRANCPKCTVIKARLDNHKIAHKAVDLDKEPQQAKILRLRHFRELPVYGVKNAGNTEYYSNGRLRVALRALKSLYEEDLKVCESFSSPCSDHFEERCNAREKQHFQAQILAIEQFLGDVIGDDNG